MTALTPADFDRIFHDFTTRPRHSRSLDRVAADIAELTDFIADHGRDPVFAYDGKIGENVLALRLHAYLCRLADLDNLPSPPNPLDTPFRRRRRVKMAAPKMVEQWEASQEFWSEGASL
ncbi:hypothetical protein [Aureimonas glaciei]|nr:hypothetical protein [Aureimonas glaciei]